MNLDHIISRLVNSYTSNPALDLKNLTDIVKAYNSKDYLKHIEYSDKTYNRVVLFRNDEFEILLLCWKPRQASGFHQHAANGCIMKVLQGSISEERKERANDRLSKPI